MSWLDRTIALPTIGILMSPQLRPNGDLLRAIKPVIEAWGSTDIKIAQSSLLDLTVNDSRGFSVSIDTENVVATFKLNWELKRPPGKPPEFAPSDVSLKFADLLKEVTDRAVAVVTALYDQDGRDLRRLGLVSACRIDASTPLPGVECLLKHLATPWGTDLTIAEGRFLATVGDGDGFVDRCHHHISVTRTDKPGEHGLALDFQRVYEPALKFKSNEAKNVTKLLDDVRKAALAYFEKFAKGDLNYAPNK